LIANWYKIGSASQNGSAKETSPPGCAPLSFGEGRGEGSVGERWGGVSATAKKFNCVTHKFFNFRNSRIIKAGRNGKFY